MNYGMTSDDLNRIEQVFREKNTEVWLDEQHRARALRKFALLEGIPLNIVGITVGELAEAFKQLAEVSRDLPVMVVLGNGREKHLCGWELVTRVSSLDGQRVRMRLFTDSPF